jgi:dsRNA-specific ribonuclease
VRLLIDDKEVSTGADFVKKKAEQIAAEIACKQLGLL